MAEIHSLGNAEGTYLQLANTVQARIQAGEFTHRLPAERDLAGHYGVAYQTVRHAIEVLRRRGVLITRHGRGTFIVPPAEPGPPG